MNTLPDARPATGKPRTRGRRAAKVTAAVCALALLAAAAATPHWASTTRSAPSPPWSPSNAASRPAIAPCLPPAALTAAQLKARAQQYLDASPTPLPTSSPSRQALATVTAGPSGCDAAPDRMAYVHLLQWATDTTIDGTTTSAVLFQEQRWRADDASGRVIRSRYPAANLPTDDRTHYPGSLDGHIGPVAADPAALAAQINTIQPRFLGPAAVLRGLSGLLGWRTPDQAARTAVLTVLRDTEGLSYHTPVTDRAGRTGVGVSAISDHGATRDLLILNPTTGELLAYERAALTPPPGSNRPAPAVEDYHLFLVHTHTDTTNIGTS